MHEILTRNRVTLETFKDDPLRVMKATNGKAIAVMSVEDVEFYAVPVALYARLRVMEKELLDKEFDSLMERHAGAFEALAKR